MGCDQYPEFYRIKKPSQINEVRMKGFFKEMGFVVFGSGCASPLKWVYFLGDKRI
jgi:hypothetical protein